MLGASLGTSSITIFVESGVGIGVGGRSGLTAVFCSIFMLLFLPLGPLLFYVPVEATTGALLWVGLQLIPKWKDAMHFRKVEIISIFVMLFLVAWTFSLDKAMLFGFAVYIVGKVISGEKKDVSPYLVFSTLMLLIGSVLTLINHN